MPHKKAKRSVRELTRSEKDLAPPKDKLSNEPVPKSVARVLNAAHVQAEWKEKNKKRKLEEDSSGSFKKRRTKDGSDAGGAQKMLRIQHGESLAHFNRRVESSLQGTVRAAVRTSSAKERETRREEQSKKNLKNQPKGVGSQDRSRPSQAVAAEDITPEPKAAKQRATEFTTHSTSTPRRLNDIVQAPPEFKVLPRGVKVSQTGKKPAGSLRDGVLSMAQKAMLDGERERVVKLYREMKKMKAES